MTRDLSRLLVEVPTDVDNARDVYVPGCITQVAGSGKAWELDVSAALGVVRVRIVTLEARGVVAAVVGGSKWLLNK